MLPPQTPGSTRPPKTLSTFFRCPSCGASLAIPHNFIELQFSSNRITCPECSANDTPWRIALKVIQEEFMFTYLYIIGAQSTLFSTKLYLNTYTYFDLHTEGLPINAIILDMNISSEGMFCMESNGYSRKNINRSAHLQLYGFHTYTSPDIHTEEGVANICVTWAASSENDTAWNNLVSAFDAYTNGDFRNAIVPANVAVESKLLSLMEKTFSGITNKKHASEFLRSAATYSHQLNILLPLVIKMKNIPPLDPIIRGLLNSLRDARNSVAHRGEHNQLSKNRTAEFLTAALFGLRYLDYIDNFS